LDEYKRILPILESKIKTKKKNPEKKQQELEISTRYFAKVKQEVKLKQYIKEVLEELGKVKVLTPGKTSITYHFADIMTAKDVGLSEHPNLFIDCPYCAQPHPLIVEFLQKRYESMGYEWQKNCFIICPQNYELFNIASHKSNFH